MKKGDKKKFYNVLVFLLVIGAVIVVANTRAESTEIVQERTVDQYSTMFFTYTIIKYPARVEVLRQSLPGENLTIGFNAGTDILDFSRVETGSYVKKQINLTANDGNPSKIIVSSKGSIKPLLKFSRNSFILTGNDVIDVTMDSGTMPIGNYTGDVSVTIQRSNNDVLKFMLGY